MGQRLNIEIVDGEESLANCYYHWSAYTVCALNLVYKIIEAYKSAKAISGVALAVELLEATGAGVPERERVKMAADPDLKDISFCVSLDAINRNDGLIGVTETEKETTRYWEEGRVTIDISSETFDFDVAHPETKSSYYEVYQDSDYPDFDELPEIPYDLDMVPFRKIGSLIDFAENNQYGARLPDDDIAVCWVV